MMQAVLAYSDKEVSKSRTNKLGPVTKSSRSPRRPSHPHNPGPDGPTGSTGNAASPSTPVRPHPTSPNSIQPLTQSVSHPHPPPCLLSPLSSPIPTNPTTPHSPLSPLSLHFSPQELKSEEDRKRPEASRAYKLLWDDVHKVSDEV